MRTPQKEDPRSTASPRTSFLNLSQPADIPDSFFFDPPTVNNSVLGAQLRDPSLVSFLVTDTDGASGADPTPRTTATTAAPNTNTSSSESVCRRGEAYRRTNPAGGPSSITPRVRSLESVAVSMKTDMVGSNALSLSTASGTPAERPPSYLTRAALAEHLEPSCTGTPAPDPHDGLPLLPMRDGALLSAAGAAGANVGSTKLTTSPSLPRPSEEAEGSVHVATRRSRRSGGDATSEQDGEAPPGLSSSSARRLHASEFDSGFELSMESVTLQLSERRYFRFHPVTYLEDCTLHIAPGSMHCIASLNSLYARAALAVLAGVDSVSSARGATLANALPVSSLRYRRQVAYVASLDCCTEEATVYDNLAFATSIRFKVDAQALREIVEQAASDAFLMDQLHTRASDLGAARRYLLAIAMELVAEPTVLLLEDPLSYFSLAELQLFIQLLHSMRRRNPARTVVWSSSTIPWTLFDSIDNVTLLTTDGKTFYTGDKRNVEAFLQEDLGILRVPGEDVMDIMAQTEVDAVAVTHATICFHNSKFYRQVQHEVEAHRTRIAANAFPMPPEPPQPAPSYGSVQLSLLAYTLRRNVLGKAALVPWVGLLVVMVLVCVLVAVSDGKQGRNLQNTCGVVFLLLSCSLQINSIFFKSELRDWRTFSSFRNNLYFPLAPYYVATIVRLLVPRLCFAVAGSICGALVFAQATSASLSVMMALLSFAHACLGLVAVYWFPRLEMLTAANHIYYAYCVICCGYLMSTTQIPVFFQVLSLLRVAYGGVLPTEIGSLTWCNGTASYDDDGSATDSTYSPDCFTGKSYLMLMGLQNDSLGQSVLGLSLFSLAMVAAVVLSMHLSPLAKMFFSS